MRTSVCVCVCVHGTKRGPEWVFHLQSEDIVCRVSCIVDVMVNVNKSPHSDVRTHRCVFSLTMNLQNRYDYDNPNSRSEQIESK